MLYRASKFAAILVASVAALRIPEPTITMTAADLREVRREARELAMELMESVCDMQMSEMKDKMQNQMQDQIQTMCDEVVVELDRAVQEGLISYSEAESIAGRCVVDSDDK